MNDSIADALDRWREGDEMAAFQLDRILRAELLGLVRAKRSPQFRGRIDSEAIVNAAMKSFLSGIRNDEFPMVQGRADVKRLLAHFAICVLKDQIRAAGALRRDVRREVGMSSEHAAVIAGASAPSPEEELLAVEYLEKFADIVRDQHESAIEILELSLEGMTPNQIAEVVGLRPRTIQKLIADMIAAWEEYLANEERD